jgi:hypothetical protein
MALPNEYSQGLKDGPRFEGGPMKWS